MTARPNSSAGRVLIAAVCILIVIASVQAGPREAYGPTTSDSPTVVSATPIDTTSSLDEDGVLKRPSRPNPKTKAQRADSSIVPVGGSMLLPLLVVVATICGAAYMFRKWVNPTQKIGNDGAIKVLARQYLSSKQCLCLVRLGHRLVLLGVTPERITSVTQIDDPEEVAGIISTVNRAGSHTFSAAFAAIAGRRPSSDMEYDVNQAEPDELILPGKLSETRSNVRDVLGRIRALSERGMPAEPV